MKFFLLATFLTLMACQNTTQSSATSQISARQLASQSDLSAITGKTLSLNAGQSFVISDDGTFSGSWDGRPLIGTYEMRDGFFCRTLLAGPRGPLPEDCQLLVLDGNTLNGTRDRGNGVSFTYTFS